MKRNMIYGLAALMLAGTLVTSSGCRGTRRTVVLFPGDRNVTVVKKSKRHKVKGRKRAIKHNKMRKW